jgi:malate synthase
MTLAGTIEIRDASDPNCARVLTPDAVAFVLALDSEFAARRIELLARRRLQAARIRRGYDPDFQDQTASTRSDPDWQVAPPAPGLSDRRVEITGPPDRKMTVNALNSGASVWMADFEDATSPRWRNVVDGQANLIDAITGQLDFVDGGKQYRVGPDPATIVVRPRGWHLVEKHLIVDGRPVSASIFDFALYLFHCGRLQIERGSGPYFYLPKLQSAQEARLWNDIFLRSQEMLGLPRGTIRATVLIETIHAAFEMDEILFELREHSAGLNAGRWDYLFSIIKAFADRGSDYVLPDRSSVTMTAPFMRAYTQLLVRTCHRRGAHAIGGMSAYIPSRDPVANERALEQVRGDKEREATDGFDGSWVAHPGLVPVCRDVFDARLGDHPNQIDWVPDSGSDVAAVDLLAVSKTPGQVTVEGVRANLTVALRYLNAWLNGSGAVAINGLMEDVATAEIARCQVWQWLRNQTPLADGSVVDDALVEGTLATELERAKSELGPSRLNEAAAIVTSLVRAEVLQPFLTTHAYAEYLLEA